MLHLLHLHFHFHHWTECNLLEEVEVETTEEEGEEHGESQGGAFVPPVVGTGPEAVDLTVEAVGDEPPTPQAAGEGQTRLRGADAQLASGPEGGTVIRSLYRRRDKKQKVNDFKIFSRLNID